MGVNRVNNHPDGFKHFEIHGANYSPRRPALTTQELPPGLYHIAKDDGGNLYYVPMSTVSDSLIKLPDTVSEAVVKEIREFWKAETKKKFDQYNLIYKRGILLHGKQGTGKTCTIIRIIEDVIADGGIAIFNTAPQLLYHGVRRLREIQPNMRIVAVFEEFDNYCNDSDYKSLLDGELQIENIVYVATTNYIDEIPNTFKNRPSRFARVLEVGPPSEEARKIYLENRLLPQDQTSMNEWIAITKGMVLDQIKDLIVSVCCFGMPLTEAAAKICLMDAEGEVAVNNGSMGTAVQELQKKLQEAISPKQAITVSFNGVKVKP
jgi:hypothetical protein